MSKQDTPKKMFQRLFRVAELLAESKNKQMNAASSQHAKDQSQPAEHTKS